MRHNVARTITMPLVRLETYRNGMKRNATNAQDLALSGRCYTAPRSNGDLEQMLGEVATSQITNEGTPQGVRNRSGWDWVRQRRQNSPRSIMSVPKRTRTSTICATISSKKGPLPKYFPELAAPITGKKESWEISWHAAEQPSQRIPLMPSVSWPLRLLRLLVVFGVNM